MEHKYFFSIIITFLIFNSSIYGQLKFMGGKLGLNLSKLNYESDLKGYDFNFRNGFNGGLFLEYQLSNEFLVHTEINYSMRGTEYGADAKLGFPKHKFIQKLNYVEVPITFQYNLPLQFIIVPKVFIGPEISFLMTAKTEYIENDVHQTEVDEKNHFKSTEYGVVFGVGGDYNFKYGKLLFDVRYYYGLSNINEARVSKIISTTILFNLGFGVSL